MNADYIPYRSADDKTVAEIRLILIDHPERYNKLQRDLALQLAVQFLQFEVDKDWRIVSLIDNRNKNK